IARDLTHFIVNSLQD
nr:Two-protein-system connector protein SafA [Escherichia coli]